MGIVETAMRLFGGKPSPSAPQPSSKVEAPEAWPPHPPREGRSREKSKRTRRMFAEKNFGLARAGKGGYFSVKTLDGERVVFNIWVSRDGVDRRGNPIRVLHPKSLYGPNGEVIARIRSERGVKDPSLPIGVLYGRRVDPDRLPEDFREDLLVFAEVIHRLQGEYEENASRRHRRG